MKIFISGIGGTGLGPLAELALDAGIKVVGSDLNHSPNTAELERRGVKIVYEQTFAKIREIYDRERFDWFVHSSAIPSDSEELRFCEENGVKHTKRDEFLADFIREKNLKMIAIAGTHGKTTTTSMLIWIFHELGIGVSHSVGSTLSFAPAAHFSRNSKFFIYEADEYDRNFLAYAPAVSAIVSLDYDHADIYPTVAEYREAFREFITNSDKTFVWKSTYDQLFPRLDPAENIVILSQTSEYFSRNPINLPGEKIRENAYLALEICRDILDDFDEEKVREILARFPGADRRFERIRENLFSDYAHAPAEIHATLQKAREIANQSGQKIVTIYQPHQNARQIEVFAEGGYADAFQEADEIFWLPTYLNRMDLLPDAPKVLAPEDLIATLSGPTKNLAQPAEFNADLANIIREKLGANNIVVALGAGPIDSWIRENFAK
jgi:UDP-N-acetylmuramate--alanine ligase